MAKRTFYIATESAGRKDRSVSVSNIRNFTCIIPTVEILSKQASFSKFRDSHDWQVVSVEKQRGEEILARSKCRICGLSSIFLLSDIQDSEKRTNGYKDKEKLR